MPKRLLVVPPALILVLILYGLAVPSHRSAGQSPAATPTDESAVTPTPVEPASVVATPIATPATALIGGLPSGLTGQLTYRTGHELVTVAFPSAEAIEHRTTPPIDGAVPSADGLWFLTQDCNDTCRLRLQGPDGIARTFEAPQVAAFRWSLRGHQLAFTTSDSGERPAPYHLMLLDDLAAGDARSIYETRSGYDHPFEWLSSGELLVADNSPGDSRMQRVGPDGSATTLATVPSTVWYLYASPDRRTVAFTQDSRQGWQLWTIDGATGAVRNAGNMGSDPAGVAPPVENAPTPAKGPIYIAWSPDGARVAFGGGYEPPYLMTIADITSGVTKRTEFPDGYPGEIKWSPDGTRLAVSSYNVPRTHHESYIVDPDTGLARDVLSGCVIVWSPGSRFLAVHGEREPGIAIADVSTFEHAQLTHTASDTPLSWEP